MTTKAYTNQLKYAVFSRLILPTKNNLKTVTKIFARKSQLIKMQLVFYCNLKITTL